MKKAIKKIGKVTVLLICLTAAGMMLWLGLRGMMDNASYGLADSDFACACFFTVAAVGWIVMTLENITGGRFHISFERRNEESL